MAGLIAGLLGVIAMALAVAQAPLAFDAASIKESASLEAGGSMRLMPGGGIRTYNIPARNLITIAYELQSFQLIGAPEWTRTTKFDIVAKPAEARTRDEIFLMMRTLLSDRFKLSIHRENREVDGYALVRVRAGELGPSLKPSAVDCEKAFATTPRCREGGLDFGATNSMKRVGIPIWSLLQTVIGQMGGPVSDETRLTGTYDVNLRWSTEVAPTDDAPTFVTALQEQLGLKLERKRVTTEVVVVDHIERPAPD
jgi:uncharacterized protein (TIGR03435 family)